MIYEWIEKNLDPKKVVDKIVRFLETKDFGVTSEETAETWQVSAFRRYEGQNYVVFIKVYGRPNDLYVAFDRNTQGRFFGMFGNVVSSFGLGVLARRDLNKEAYLNSLELTFWDFMDASMPSLGKQDGEKGSTKA